MIWRYKEAFDHKQGKLDDEEFSLGINVLKDCLQNM